MSTVKKYNNTEESELDSTNAKKSNPFYTINNDKELLRPNRLSIDSSNLNLKVLINESIVNCLDISETGIKASSYDQGLEVDQEYNITIKDNKNSSEDYYTGKAKVVWQRKEGEEEVFTFGLRFTTSFLNSDFINSLKKSSHLLDQSSQIINKLESLPHSFVKLVAKIEGYLSYIKNHIDEIEVKMTYESQATKETLKDIIFKMFFPEFSNYMISCSIELDQMRDEIYQEHIKETATEYYQKHLTKFFLDSPYAKRAMEKPRSYAGDFEMMNQLYRSVPEGNSLFAALMHMYLISEPAGHSVKFRKQYFVDHFKTLTTESNNNVLSVACGPAVEIREFIRSVDIQESESFNFFLLDQDEDALLDAKKDIDTIMLNKDVRSKFNFVNASIRKIFERKGLSFIEPGIKFDFIYTAGLFDYLDQKAAKFLTSILFNSLAKNGTLVIGNFNVSLTSKTSMEMALDWHLIYRNEQQMLDLSNNLPAEVKLTTDTQKVQWLLEIKNV